MISVSQRLWLMTIVLADLSLRTTEAQVGGCSTSWVVSPNTDTNNGVTRPAANSDIACLSECLQYTGCNGVDWNPAYPAGMQCSLSGSWSTWRYNGTRHGITHYDLIFNGRCGGCLIPAWIAYADSNTVGGVAAPLATSVDLCQSACMAYFGCNGIDWNLAKSTGQQCFLSGPWTTVRNEGTQPNVTHYDLVDINNCEAPAEVNMVITTPGACFKTWVPSINSSAPGSRLTPDTTVLDCETSCLKYTGCTGIDWALNAPVGSQCFLAGKWSQPLIQGKAANVIHYEIVPSGICPATGRSRSGASTVVPMCFIATLPLLFGAMQALNNL